MRCLILDALKGSTKTQRVGILGLGAIGHVIAAQLFQKSGTRLYFFNRSPRERLRIRLFDGQQLDHEIKCILHPQTIQLDWLVICLKTYHYPGASAWFKHLIGPETKVVVIRNGLQLTAPLSAYTSLSKLMPCLIDCPTQLADDGGYQQFQVARLMIPPHALATEFQALFPSTAMTIEVVSDFKTTSWEKLSASAALGAITCLSGQPCRVFREEDIVELFRALVKEGLAVAKADGAKIPKTYLEQEIEKTRHYPPEKGSSMLNDRQKGNQIEVTAKNGVISELGKKYGIPTPLNDHFTALLKIINQK
jgi:2-dehydropantoate 2-reductase